MSEKTPQESLFTLRPRKSDREHKALYEQYSRAMFNICMRMLANREEAEDVLQESFLAAFREMHRLSSPKAFGSWLRSIVINRCIDAIRTRNRHGLMLELPEMAEEHCEEEEQNNYSVEQIRQAMEALPDGFRIILTLYLFEDHSHGMIAKKLGISEGTSKSQYARGRRRLAELLKTK